MSKKETISWPSDPYECPYCFYKASSMETLIAHFEKMGHPKKYIHQRFRIDLGKRKVTQYDNFQQLINIQIAQRKSIFFQF